jgi:hypothetical protein
MVKNVISYKEGMAQTAAASKPVEDCGPKMAHLCQACATVKETVIFIFTIVKISDLTLFNILLQETTERVTEVFHIFDVILYCYNQGIYSY